MLMAIRERLVHVGKPFQALSVSDVLMLGNDGCACGCAMVDCP
ncbi:hypothetical protein ACUHMQ_08690 [Chitinimonas sp. PSY-7]